ncbi:GNAT family N-acetyltransferase [Microbacterium sp. CJ88]|uniref:GNAT family N-acetyltransferase n=1 Tax=Microbacterium sp. CJ88 TaxID=3445672 RepID=UPI003F65BFE5
MPPAERGTVVLHTPRLRLRELEENDLEALHEVLSDPVSMHAYAHGFDLAETREWIRRQRERYAADGFGLWAMELTATGAVIGDCGLTRQRIEHDEVVEVGYHLAPAFQHRGFATEAAGACVDWAFAHLEVDEVYAKVRDTNIASMNVAIRLGMIVRRRFDVTYRGIRMPHYAFAVSREDRNGA